MGGSFGPHLGFEHMCTVDYAGGFLENVTDIVSCSAKPVDI
jgi:hypothetical protein